MKSPMLLTCVLCVMITGMAHADELSDLRAENAKLKMENQKLQQRIATLENSNQQLVVTNKQIAAQAQQTLAQKQSLYLKTTLQGDGSKTITSFARQLPLTRGKIRHSTYQLATTLTGSTASPVTMTIFAGMSPGMFRTAKELKLDIDGETLDIPVIDSESDRRRSGAGSRTGVKLYDETVVLQFTAAQIGQIAKANQVTGTLGMAVLGLGREDYNLFNVLAEALNVSQ